MTFSLFFRSSPSSFRVHAISFACSSSPSFLFFHLAGRVCVEKRILFELLLAGHWLQVEKLLALSARRIAQNLNSRNVIIAAHFAFR